VKKFDLGQSIGILANVGVIAGLVFLAIELQQNNELLAAQARIARHELRSNDANRAVFDNANLPEIIVKAKSGQPLTATELYVIQRYHNQTMLNYQFVFIEYINGLLERQDIPDVAWRSEFDSYKTGSFADYWNENKDQFLRADFVRFIETEIYTR